MIALISKRICKIIETLLHDEKWRIRLGTIQILQPLSQVLSQEESKKFLEFCKDQTEDFAYGVKEAAMNYLSDAFLNEKVTDIPKWIVEMGKADNFRKRQAAVVIMGMMAQKTSDQALKAKLIASLKTFLKDPCTNVSYLAQKYQ